MRMDPAPFTPVPVRARRDGWTPDRQAAFIDALRDMGSVVAACRRVGMSSQSAYRLRARADAISFADAWDAACARPVPTHPVGRALGGIATPIRYRGRQVGERRRYDNRLARYILAIRAPERFCTARASRPKTISDRAAAFHNALATLRADLAAGTAWQAGDDFSPDVARTSSPSAPLDTAPAPSGPEKRTVRDAPGDRTTATHEPGRAHAHRRHPAL